jgi:hypothetical protein
MFAKTLKNRSGVALSEAPSCEMVLKLASASCCYCTCAMIVPTI